MVAGLQYRYLISYYLLPFYVISKLIVMNKKCLLILLFLILNSTLTQSQTVYIAPTGNGHGYSVDTPAHISKINQLLMDTDVNKVNILPGIYQQNDALYLNGGNHHVEVIGIGEVTFRSDFNYYSGGNSGLVIARSNISFENISFLNTRYCFRFKNNSVSNVSFDRINALNTSTCIEFDYNLDKTVTDISINELNSIGYYKSGIRINGTKTQNISITNTVIDGLSTSTEEERDCHISGLIISGKSKNIFLDKVSIFNNIGRVDNCGSYQQGDGIVVNSGAQNISINNTTVSNSRDADFDIKGSDVTLNRIKSLAGKETRYNLKLWFNSFTCDECYINAANSSVIQAIGSTVRLTDSTIRIKETSKICDIRYNDNNASTVRFTNSVFLLDGQFNDILPHLEQCN